MFTALFHASAFYLLPTLLGLGIFALQNELTKRKRTLTDRFMELVHLNSETRLSSLLLQLPMAFSLGALSMFFSAFVLQFIAQMFAADFSQIYFPFIYILSLLSFIFSFYSFHTTIPIRKLMKGMLFILIPIILSSLTYILWLYNNPYPMNWDLYQHQTLSTLILKQDTLRFMTTQMSDTFQFNSYPPFFHILMAVSQYGSPLSPQFIIEYWTIISFFHLITVSVASFMLGWATTKKVGVAILSCILGTVIFDSTIAFTNLFFLPQTLAAVLFIFFFCRVILSQDTPKKLHPLFIIAPILFLSLMHYVVGLLAAVILAGLFIYLQWPRFWSKTFNVFPLVQIAVVAAIAIMLGSQFVNLGNINNGEAASYVFNNMDKLGFIQRFSGYLIFLFFPLGLLTSYQLLNKSIRVSLLLTFGFSCILFSQFPYVMKFFVLGRYFIYLFAAMGIWGLVQYLSYSVSRVMSYALVTTTVLLLLISNLYVWHDGLFVDYHFGHISHDDIDVAQFFHSSINPQALILSDPGTFFIIEGLSGVNSPGGAYATPRQRQTLFALLSENNIQKIPTLSQAVQDEVQGHITERYIVISGRSSIWIRSSEFERLSYTYNVWSSKPLTLEELSRIQRLKQSPNILKPVYSNASYAVFQIL